MRFIWILFVFVTLAELPARADTLVVTGVLVDKDGARAAGYTVRIYLSKPGVAVSSDSTSRYGVYSVVRENVDSGTIDDWYVICDQNEQMAYSKLVFERKPNKIWQAKVQDLPLRSTDKEGYSLNEASETIRVVIAMRAIKVKSRELKPEEANELATRDAARILAHTDLGQDPEVTLAGLSEGLRLNSEPNLPKLPLLNKDKFLLLRDRPEFKKLVPDVQKPITQPEKPFTVEKPLTQPIKKPVTQPQPTKPQQIITCSVCIRVGGSERCETIIGKNREELKAAAVKKICGTSSTCMQASRVPDNVSIDCNQR